MIIWKSTKKTQKLTTKKKKKPKINHVSVVAVVNYKPFRNEQEFIKPSGSVTKGIPKGKFESEKIENQSGD